MTRDELQLTYVVLFEYSDEYIDESCASRNDRWASVMRALRTIPAEWRQSIWASAHHQAYRSAADGRDRRRVPHEIAPPVDLFDAIEDRVETFHMGWRPLRVESVLVSQPQIPHPRDVPE